MTVPQKHYWKNNWMTLANLVILLTFVWNQSSWQKGTDKDIETLKFHAKNTVLHMPFDKKIEVFVPRVELDGRLKNIENEQKKSTKKQEEIYNLLLQMK